MRRCFALIALALSLAGCVSPSNGTDVSRFSMAWDHRPEAAHWTISTMSAVAAEDPVLAARIPADIDTWCPGYEQASVGERRAFWTGLISAVARYESSWNPRAAGGGGRYIGLMQISPTSAANYGCDADSAAELKDGSANLQCAVEMVAYHVASDDMVAGSGNKGIGRDWMPLRDSSKRKALAAWTREQPYCK
jgi:hypothetical protein